MELDPLLITAQIVNFLILVWLLNRFLFQPITRVMDERAARVQAELDEARQAREAAERQRQEFEQRLSGLEAEREQVLGTAREQADELKEQLTREVREQVEQLRSHWRDGVLREREGFLERLQEQVLDHTWRAMRRALADLADEDLDRRVVRSFLDRLDRLDEGQWHELVDVARQQPAEPEEQRADEEPAEGEGHEEPEGPVFAVTSAQDQPDDIREHIETAVQRHAPDAVVRFQRDPRLTCGIELRGPGRKLAWSLDDYLGSLRSAVQDTFDQLIRSRR